MDNKVTLQELKKFVKVFCDERDFGTRHTPKDMAIQMITEAAELLEHFRFYNEKEINKKMNSKESREQIEEELADIFYGVIRFAQLYDIDLSETFYKKMEKTGKKYPPVKSKQKSLQGKLV